MKEIKAKLENLSQRVSDVQSALAELAEIETLSEDQESEFSSAYQYLDNAVSEINSLLSSSYYEVVFATEGDDGGDDWYGVYVDGVHIGTMAGRDKATAFVETHRELETLRG